MKSIFFIITLILSIQSYSQESLDSLIQELTKCKKNKNKITLLNELKWLATDYSIDSGIYYAKISLELSFKEKDNIQITNQYIDLGKLYIKNNEYDNSIKNFTLASEYAILTNDNLLLAFTYHNIGNSYLYTENNTKALEFYFKALEIRELEKDTIGIAATTNNIGLVYWRLEQFDLALHYYNISLNNEIKINNLEGIASSYNNIGLIFWKRKEYDSALLYIKKSTKIKEEIGVDIKKYSDSYNNLGILYRSLLNFDSAIYYFNKSLAINKKTFNKYDIANVYNNIANIYIYNDNYSLAIKYLDSSKIICTEINNFELLRNLYDMYSAYHYENNNYLKAYEYKSLYAQYSDSLFQQDFSEQINQLQVKYETVKKEKLLEINDLALLQKDKELKTHKKIIYGFILFIIIITFLGLFLIIIYIQKIKRNNLLKIKNAEILLQKEEILTQTNNLQITTTELIEKNILLEEQKNKIEHQKEQLRNKNEYVESSIKYASTIQTASLPVKNEIDLYFFNSIIYLPKDIVSGDFYFFSKVFNKKKNQTELFFIVSDCTGHGVPGAFMSMVGIRLLNKYINENKINKPSEILYKINNDIFDILKQKNGTNKDGMDMIICKFSDIENLDYYNVTFAGAKRNLYYYDFENNDIIKVNATRKSIGGVENISFENIEIKMHKNNILYLSTDGLTDQNNEERISYGTKRLIELLKNISKNDIEEINFKVLSELEKWQNNTFQRDDITFITLILK